LSTRIVCAFALDTNKARTRPNVILSAAKDLDTGRVFRFRDPSLRSG